MPQICEGLCISQRWDPKWASAVQQPRSSVKHDWLYSVVMYNFTQWVDIFGMIPAVPDLEETLPLLCARVPYVQWRLPFPPLPLTSGCSRVSAIPHSYRYFQTTFYLHFSKSHHSVILQPPETSSHPTKPLTPNSRSSTACLCAF